MAKGKGGASAPTKNTSGADRKNGKALKKHPKVWDAQKRRLVTAKQRNLYLLSSKKPEYTYFH